MTTQPVDSHARRRSVAGALAPLGLLLVAAGTVIPLLGGGFPESPLYKWLYTAGAAMSLVAALMNPSDRNWPLQRRRWHRIEGWSAIFFCAGAAFLFIPGSAPRDWLAFTMAGAIIRIICFFRATRPFK